MRQWISHYPREEPLPICPLIVGVAVLLVAGSPATAQVTRLEITRREAVAMGQAFGAAGSYEVITGRARGELDPRDRRNRIIQDIVNSVLEYDFGGTFNYDDMSGVIERQPPTIKKVLSTLVPRVNTDGNEIAGVASVLHQAPLGTYLGWNLQAVGFFKGQLCGFTGGYISFAATRTERLAAGDPRPSLEERYGSQEGYMCVVRRAAEGLARERLLLREDAERIVKSAASTRVLSSSAEVTPEARHLAEALCR